MTFWHYHWALLRARELDLAPAVAFPFAHMAQLATPDGVCAYSIQSMAADLGLSRMPFSRAVRELWKRGALYAAGKSSRGRCATIYRMVTEAEARAVVEAWRAARRQPSSTGSVQSAQPSSTGSVHGQPSSTGSDEPSSTGSDDLAASPGEPIYEPRLTRAPATELHRLGSRAQPSSPGSQPSSPGSHYKSTIMIHESERPARARATVSERDAALAASPEPAKWKESPFPWSALAAKANRP